MLFVINNEDDTLDVIFCSDELYSLLEKRGYDNESFVNLYKDEGQYGVNELLINLGVSIPNIKNNIDINPNVPKIYFDQFISALKQKHGNIASFLQNGDSSKPEF